MKYDRSADAVIVGSDELALFAYRRPERGAPDGYETFDGYAKESDEISARDAATRVPFPDDADGVRVIVESRAEAVYSSADGLPAVCASKAVRKLPSRISPSADPSLLARAVVDAYAYCRDTGITDVKVRITFDGGDGSASLEKTFTAEELLSLTGTLVRRAAPFIRLAWEKGTVRAEELSALRFPYEGIRQGQRDLMTETMKTIRLGKKLLVCAPTGIGKTVSVLYPALKSIAGGYCDKVFYLTAKNVTGKAALDCMELLSKSAPHVRTVMIEAKEKLCSTGGYSDGCFGCAMTGDVYENGVFVPYARRESEAAAEAAEAGPILTRETLTAIAKKYRVCPYELSLDVSLFCEVVICDYNYVYDRKVSFRRYFAARERNGERDEKYVFLIDEAHNLPDRVRSMYSASVSPDDLAETASLLKSGAVTDDSLLSALANAASAFSDVRDACRDTLSVRETEGEERLTGYYTSREFPPVLASALSSLLGAALPFTRKGSEHRETFKRLTDRLSAVLYAVEESDDRFRFLAEREGDGLTCSMMCLDPSEIISRRTALSDGAVMFSATLSPREYFTGVMGFDDGSVLELDSPFDRENLSVTVFDAVSTRLTDREKTASAVAEAIDRTVNAKRGKYIVYFPSYEYMKTVCREYLKLKPEQPAVMQKRSMTKSERARFLSIFSSREYDAVTGFSVLGGMFSEGIDLTGDSLIGVIIVGAGLSGISSHLNMMSEYYQNKYEQGYEFAYLFPAMNKIQQAVGRVIRTESDRGVAVLIDHRLGDPGAASLFPESWQPVKRATDADELTAVLRAFWEREKSGEKTEKIDKPAQK